MQTQYERTFYENLGRDENRSVEAIVPIILEYIQPRSIVDIGCGVGAWLKSFHDRGVAEVLGIDGPWVDADLLRIDRESFRVADLAEPLAFTRQFDLVISLEVAEHLPATAAETFVGSLTSAGSVILFSAAVPHQQGYLHINEQWPRYWSQLFAKRGFATIDCLRRRIWHDPNVEWWYAQNMFFAVAQAQLDKWPVLSAAKDIGEPIDLVHPRLFLQSTTRAKRPKELFHAALGATRDALLRRPRR